MTETPLVSICIPVFNRAELIWRALESCINQTYKNIEIVVSDNASADNTKAVVLEYARRNKRVKYFRNEINIGSGNNYLKSIERASGYFAQTLGSDDWLSRNYVHECVQNFLINPEAAAILTNTITFELQKDNYLRFIGENPLKSGRYSADWFFKNFYNHPYLGGKGFLSLMRREDLIQSLKTEVARPTSSVDRGDFFEVIDGTIFFGVLIKYNYFAVTKDAAYVTLFNQKDAVGLKGGFSENFEGRLRYALIIRRAFETIYGAFQKLIKYERRMSFSMSLSFVARTFLDLLKMKAKPTEWGRRYAQIVSVFLKDYTKQEKLMLAFLILPYFLIRIPNHLKRWFAPKPIFTPSRNYSLTDKVTFATE